MFQYKNIVFDMGNVLVAYDADRVTREYTSDPALIREVHNLIFCSQEWLKLDAGLCSEEAALASMLKRFQSEEERKLAEKCFRNWDRYNMWAMPGMEEVVRALKAAGHGIYVLSNASLRLPGLYRELMPAAELYDGVFFSASYQLIKPQRGIYERFLSEFGLTARDCFFIDDLQENIEGAAAVGIDGYCFADRNIHKLCSRLEVDPQEPKAQFQRA